MNSATLLENFDLLADAPGGVPKLRGLILQLAVRGKLVPQEEGEVHHEGHEEHEGKKEGERIEGPYAVPPGWRWTTLAQAGKVNPRNEAADDMEVGFAPMAVISDRYGVTPAYERRLWRDVKKGFTHFAEGDIGVAKITPCFENGKSAVFRNVPNGIGAGTTELHIFRPVIGMVIPDYVWIFLKSPRFRTGGEAVMTGSAGQKRVPADYFAKTPFPLPPLAEQKRIVARVDELMKRCDELEARQNERNERHKVTVSACLHAATDPRKPNPNFIIHPSSFNLLFTSPSSVAELRKTILQLAVQGRLVKQEKTHHEGHEEHEGQTEGERLDAPYVLPQGWRWAAFSEIATVTGGVTKGRRLTGNTACYPYLRVANVQRGWLDLTEIKEIQIGVSELHRYALRRGDLLITEGGDWDKVGRMAVWRGEIEPCLHQNHVFRARITADAVCSDWILMYFNSEARGYFERAAKQTTNLASINMRQLRACPISLPPLAEQKRIVAKVNELMTLCDALEAKLTRSRANADALAAAVVHHLCSDVTRPKEATA